MAKRRADERVWNLPRLGNAIQIPLVSIDATEEFILDIGCSRTRLAKGTYQNRVRKIVPLARLDFGGPPHRNPDGAEIGSPRLHIYRAGWGDRWAEPVSLEQFSNPGDKWQLLEDFMRLWKIVTAPVNQRELFE